MRLVKLYKMEVNMKILRILGSALFGLIILANTTCSAGLNRIVIHSKTINSVLKTGFTKQNSRMPVWIDVDSKFKKCYSKQIQNNVASSLNKEILSKKLNTNNITNFQENITLKKNAIKAIDKLSEKIQEYINDYAKTNAQGFLDAIGLNKKKLTSKSVLVQSALAWSRTSVVHKKTTELCLDTRSNIKTVSTSNKKLLAKAIGAMIAEQYSKSTLMNRSLKNGSIIEQPKFAIILLPTQHTKLDAQSLGSKEITVDQLGLKKADYVDFMNTVAVPDEMWELYDDIVKTNQSSNTLGTYLRDLMKLKRFGTTAYNGKFMNLGQMLLNSFGIPMQNYLEQELSLSGIAHILKWICYISISVSMRAMTGDWGPILVSGAFVVDGLVNKESRNKLLGIIWGKGDNKSEMRKIFNLENLKKIFCKLAKAPGHIIRIVKQNPGKTILLTLSALMFIYFIVVPLIAPMIGVAANALCNSIVSLASNMTGLSSSILAALGLVNSGTVNAVSSAFRSTNDDDDDIVEPLENPVNKTTRSTASIIGDSLTENNKIPSQAINLDVDSEEICVEPNLQADESPGSSKPQPALNSSPVVIDTIDVDTLDTDTISLYDQATSYLSTTIPYVTAGAVTVGAYLARSGNNSPFLNGVPNTVRGL